MDRRQARGLCSAIEQEAERLKRLVGNLLDLSRIEAGSLRPQKSWQDLEALIEDTLDRLRSVTAHHHLHVDIAEDLPQVWIDPVEIGQVIYNLIENATKYAHPETEITLEVRRISGALALVVSDRGPAFHPVDSLICSIPSIGHRRPAATAGPWAGTGHRPRPCRGARRACVGREPPRRWRAVHVHRALWNCRVGATARARDKRRVSQPSGAASWWSTTSLASCARCSPTSAATTSMSTRRRVARRPSTSMRACAPSWCCWTWACQTWMAWTSSGIRKRANTPIVVLSSRETERDKVDALDLGADDYLTKPFGMDELLARMRVALRHAAHPDSGTEPVRRFDELEVDLERRRVVVAGNEVRLTPTEWDLVKLLTSHPNKVLTIA